jgi:uncharacterized protein (DUF58 family)
MLTRNGWASVLLATSAVVMGRLFGVLELIIIGAGIIVLVVSTAVWVHLRPISLTVTRRVVPESLHVGDMGRVELCITNTSWRATSPLSLWEPVAGMGGATLQLAPLYQQESAVANYRLPAVRRGTVVFGPLTVERHDPFGLCTRRRVVGTTSDITILAAYFQLTFPSGMGGSGPLGDHLRARALGRVGSEFHSLREYIDGDDLRQIHWRASARSETLKVRHVEPEGLRHCTIELDTTSREYSPEGFERAVSAAASAVYAATQAGLRIRLVVGDMADLRNTTATDALLTLADCALADRAPARVHKAPHGDGLGLTVVITGSPRSAAVSAARLSLTPTDVMVIVACSSVGGAGRDFIVDATSNNAFVASWSLLTGTNSRAGTGSNRATTVG